ncbi:MAG: DUF3486 family protein [Desulfobacteraceae bacterium]|nr:DUF3486 family protein [Desulfobacteraceae bacterium]
MTSGTPSKKTKSGGLPPAVRKKVERLLLEGMSYEDIGRFLSSQGYAISKTEIGRYGEKFLEALQRFRILEEKARVLASDGKNSLLHDEAVSRLFLSIILEAQLAGKIDMKDLPKLMSDFARLQSANVQREKLRLEFERRAKKVAKDVEKHARGGGLSDGTVDEIRNKILGIVK